MEIRKQLLGIVIGIFITLSFITPVHSELDGFASVCDMTQSEFEKTLKKNIMKWGNFG